MPQNASSNHDDSKSNILQVAERREQSITDTCGSETRLEAKICPCCGRRINNEKIRDAPSPDKKLLSCGSPQNLPLGSRRMQGVADTFHDLGSEFYSSAFHPPKPISCHRAKFDRDSLESPENAEGNCRDPTSADDYPARSTSELSHYQIQKQSNRYIQLRGKRRCPPRVTTPEIQDMDYSQPSHRHGASSVDILQEPIRERTPTPVGASSSIFVIKRRSKKGQVATGTFPEADVRTHRFQKPSETRQTQIMENENSGQAHSKHVVVEAKSQPSENEAKRDHLNWGKRCKAAQRLSIYLRKGISGDIASEPLKYMSTVNLLCPDPATVLNVSREDINVSQEFKNPISAENSSMSLNRCTAASLTFNRTSSSYNSETRKAGTSTKPNQNRKFRENSIDAVGLESSSSNYSLPSVVGSSLIGHSLDELKDSQSSLGSKDSGAMKYAKRTKVHSSSATESLTKEQAQNESVSGQPHIQKEEVLTGIAATSTDVSSFFLTSTNACTSPSKGADVVPAENTDPVEQSEAKTIGANKHLNDEPLNITFLGPQGSHPAHLLGGLLHGQAPPGKETIFTSFVLNLVRERRLPRDVGCATMPLHLYDRQVKATLRTTQEMIEEMQAHHERKLESRRNFVLFRKKGLEEIAREALQRFLYGRMVQLWTGWRDLTLEGRNIRALKTRIQAPRASDPPGLLHPKLVRPTLRAT